jgi:hypothetical protein
MKTHTVIGAKGINEQAEKADKLLELADARNVWAPDGKIESRPGFLARSMAPFDAASTAMTGEVCIVEDVSDVGSPYTTYTAGSTVDLSPGGAGLVGRKASVAGDRIYFGVDSITATTNGWKLPNGNNNTSNNCYGEWEYYNGSTWKPLYLEEGNGNAVTTTKSQQIFETNEIYQLLFTPPKPLILRLIPAL